MHPATPVSGLVHDRWAIDALACAVSSYIEVFASKKYRRDVAVTQSRDRPFDALYEVERRRNSIYRKIHEKPTALVLIREWEKNAKAGMYDEDHIVGEHA